MTMGGENDGGGRKGEGGRKGGGRLAPSPLAGEGWGEGDGA